MDFAKVPCEVVADSRMANFSMSSFEFEIEKLHGCNFDEILIEVEISCSNRTSYHSSAKPSLTTTKIKGYEGISSLSSFAHADVNAEVVFQNFFYLHRRITCTSRMTFFT